MSRIAPAQTIQEEIDAAGLNLQIVFWNYVPLDYDGETFYEAAAEEYEPVIEAAEAVDIPYGAYYEDQQEYWHPLENFWGVVGSGPMGVLLDTEGGIVDRFEYEYGVGEEQNANDLRVFLQQYFDL